MESGCSGNQNIAGSNSINSRNEGISEVPDEDLELKQNISRSRNPSSDLVIGKSSIEPFIILSLSII